MKICVVGAGSIGGLLGVKLALLKEDVTLIARGAHLAAIKQHGIKFVPAYGIGYFPSTHGWSSSRLSFVV